ncbi:glycosyltransferase family 4 protein [Bifidobacterium pullorum]|uniref:glycosyltransferase family 4 protein n=1 Tax=Bifidobacterium pullorum TaxID=78448 RepID=UPI0009DFF514|nr:glycosyltransferase family 4 protein [Bifidobacterium pullorum]
MKIAVLSRKSISDVSQWSGSIHFLCKALSSEHEIIPVVVPELHKKIIQKIVYYLSLKRIKRSNIYLFIDKLLIKNKLAKIEYDYIFAPAASDLVASGGIPSSDKIIYLSDATYHLMVDYYFFNESKYDINNGNYLECKCLNRSNYIIECSEWAAKDVKEFYRVNSDKITVLPLFSYMSDEYVPVPYEKMLDKTKHNIQLLLVGVDWYRKGIDIAIDTVNYLNNSNSNIKYVLNIVGVDCRSVNLPNYIRVWGRLNKDIPKQKQQLIELYNTSDIFILPTRAECAGIVFSESSMFGLPVVTFDTGGIASYVRNNYNGFRLNVNASYKEFAEKIKFLSKPNELYKFSMNARHMYESILNQTTWLNNFNSFIQKKFRS